MGVNLGGGIGLFSSTAQNGTANLDIGSATGATTTLSANNDYYKADATSNAMVFILPAASTVKGKVFTIQKVDSTFNIVTLNDGSAVTTLNTLNEAAQLVSDGASYQIMNRCIPENWVSYTPTLTGFGTGTSLTFFYKRSGSDIQIKGSFAPGTPTATEARVTIPTGLTSATTDITTRVGDYVRQISNANKGGMLLNAVSTNFFKFSSPNIFGPDAADPSAAANGDAIISSGQVLSMNAIIPITGWNG